RLTYLCGPQDQRLPYKDLQVAATIKKLHDPTICQTSRLTLKMRAVERLKPIEIPRKAGANTNPILMPCQQFTKASIPLNGASLVSRMRRQTRTCLFWLAPGYRLDLSTAPGHVLKKSFL
ncbi:MAG TPA: hypothetical protein VKB96_07185, partial [Gammaproteobacteria bacterium]|nr:hypothetical protein [Gammaproteobacteria bacterium]